MTVLLCGSSQTHLGTSMPSGGGHIIRAVELLNPKTVLFFALFLPPFVAQGAEPANAGNLTTQLLLLGILVPLTAITADLLVAGWAVLLPGP
ncbi:hypothetical protein G8O29_07990 [Rhodobacter sp. M37P]|uniref:LysE type translocator n=1 Tax=Rhodobacter calidifons TaxID=2715277 RepID=A0ABX0G5Y1_9RHOB|nr:hypothetical protein [Rhodobacter calidifons]